MGTQSSVQLLSSPHWSRSHLVPNWSPTGWCPNWSLPPIFSRPLVTQNQTQVSRGSLTQVSNHLENEILDNLGTIFLKSIMFKKFVRGREFEDERRICKDFALNNTFTGLARKNHLLQLKFYFGITLIFLGFLAKSKVYFKWISGHFFGKEEIQFQLEIMQLYFSLLAKK